MLEKPLAMPSGRKKGMPSTASMVVVSVALMVQMSVSPDR